MRYVARYVANLKMVGAAGVLLFLWMALSGYSSPGAIEFENQKREHGLQVQIDVTMTAAENPVLGQPLPLKITVTPLIDAAEVRFRWGIPEGVTLLDGPMEESLGAMAAGQTLAFERQVRIDSPGTHRIGVEGSFQASPALTYGDAAILFFTVDERGGSVSNKDPHARARLSERIPLGPEAGAIPFNETQAELAAANCVVSFGKVTRIDRAFDGSVVVEKTVPVTGAVVELWEDDLIFDDHVDTMNPDASGDFIFTSCEDDGLFDDDMEYYIKVVARAVGDGETIATVRSDPWFWIDLPDVPFLDDGTWAFETDVMKADEPESLNFGEIHLNAEMSGVINIAEGMFQAWKFWQDHDGDENRIEHDEVDVYWSPGDSYGTYYVGVLDNLYIKGEHDDPDEFDDTVIMHEWAHFADDKWGCDDNPGGTHTGVNIVDPELAWGEGYPTFYQALVRTSLNEPLGHFYVDVNGMGGCGICFNLELFNVLFPGSVSEQNELSIVGALWDLVDASADGQDFVALPDAATLIQSVYLDEGFIDGDDCDFPTYLRYWQSTGKPTDAAVAAVITQNTKLTDVFTSAEQFVAGEMDAEGIALVQHVSQSFIAPEDDYRWWKRVTYVVDNSLSMAGQRLDAIKTVLQEQVEDLFASESEGVEFRLDTFNNTTPVNQRVFAGQFYPDPIKDAIGEITNTTQPDSECPVDAFGALKQSVAGESNVSAWLFTDRYPAATLAPLENFRAELVRNNVEASFAVLQTSGGDSCITGLPTQQTLDRQQGLQRQWLFTAGNAPAEPSDSILPYLLTAQATGGQFLFVEEGEMDSAAQILQAQLSHNAGAGRWSDYVSHQPTYRYDRLAEWEYEWIAADVIGTAQPLRPGEGDPEGHIDVTLPSPFTFYTRTATVAHVFENGYITFGDNLAKVPENTSLSDAAAPNAALFPYWDNLGWSIVTAQAQQEATASPEDSINGNIFTAQVDDWFVIQYDGFFATMSNCPVLFEACELFQVLLNLETGEIRYQYHTLTGDVGSATIGIKGWPDMNPVDAVQVAFNDGNAADSGMGYRFVPVPPQATKSYTVAVDSTMESIGFLLTGFSGTLAPMSIRTPDNTPIVCNTAGVSCVNVGMVQYVQVNVDDRTGLWTVEVQPGASGSGTFSFSSMAAGALPVTNNAGHTLPSFEATVLTVDMGQPLDGGQMTGYFQTPSNQGFGLPFTLFDDGQHGDGEANDGRFGSNPVIPEGVGTAYLWVEGELGGEPIRRVEEKPYFFQPLRLSGPATATHSNAKTVVNFTLANGDSISHTYRIDVQVPQGWRGQLDLAGDGTVTVGPGISRTVPIAIWMGPTDPASRNQPSGTTGTVNVAAIETEQGMLNDSAAVQVTRHRGAAYITVVNDYPFVQVDTVVPLKFTVVDTQTVSVQDGVVLSLDTTLGSLPASVTTVNGFAQVDFATGSQTGLATITVQAGNGISTTYALSITKPLAETIELTTSADELPANGTATARVVATVRDDYGTPVANQVVRIGLEGGGDGPNSNQFGTLGGSEVMSGTTNASGEFEVTFTSGTVPGTASLRAELFAVGVKVGEARREIELTSAGPQPYLYLPSVRNRAK